jgi:hypothetical protein
MALTAYSMVLDVVVDSILIKEFYNIS